MPIPPGTGCLADSTRKLSYQFKRLVWVPGNQLVLRSLDRDRYRAEADVTGNVVVLGAKPRTRSRRHGQILPSLIRAVVACRRTRRANQHPSPRGEIIRSGVRHTRLDLVGEGQTQPLNFGEPSLTEH